MVADSLASQTPVPVRSQNRKSLGFNSGVGLEKYVAQMGQESPCKGLSKRSIIRISHGIKLGKELKRVYYQFIYLGERRVREDRQPGSCVQVTVHPRAL